MLENIMLIKLAALTYCLSKFVFINLMLVSNLVPFSLVGEEIDAWIPVDVSFIKEFWLPDAEILNLKEFKTLDVLSKVTR